MAWPSPNGKTFEASVLADCETKIGRTNAGLSSYPLGSSCMSASHVADKRWVYDRADAQLFASQCQVLAVSGLICRRSQVDPKQANECPLLSSQTGQHHTVDCAEGPILLPNCCGGKLAALHRGMHYCGLARVYGQHGIMTSGDKEDDGRLQQRSSSKQ